MLRVLGCTRDRLGMAIDAGIRETVAVLNLLGLPTTQSCEGHVNDHGHGLPAPWVDFDLADPDVPIRAQMLLQMFYASDSLVDDDVRLTLDRGRLSNGGGFAALDATRAALGQGELTPDQVRELHARLAARQAEMRRFASFLKDRLDLSEAA